MKEIDPRGPRVRPTSAYDSRLDYRYEDGYDAEIHPNFESLSEDFAEYAEGTFAAYNVPIWIEYDEESEAPAVDVGVLLTRHGLCMIWRSPATPEQFQELQLRILRIWANRADTGFGRFLVRPEAEPNRDGSAEPAQD